MKRHLLIICLSAALFFGCKGEPDSAREASEVEGQGPELAIARTAGRTPGYNPERNAYFGNVHVHTAWSFDAYTNGSITSPDDAYRWAKGETINGGFLPGMPELTIGKPLDFYMVSDHAVYMGVFLSMENPESPLSKLDIAKEVTSPDLNLRAGAYGKVKTAKNTKGGADPLIQQLSDPVIMADFWQKTIEIAQKHYEPGTFTTFTGYEWTSSPNNLNLHRNIIFKNNDNLPDLPLSSIDTEDPEDLWKWMDDLRVNGATLLAIPHNGNVSDGLMFSNLTYTDKPITRAYSEMRMRNEPLYEISQIKGTSETHPELSPNDEFANFEIWDYTLAAMPTPNENKDGGYFRKALRDGLRLESEGKGNPFKYGIIGDSDTHNSAASIEEDNFTGKFGFENNPEERIKGVLDTEAQNRQLREFGSGGLNGVWAEENTREAIFEAMERKETFGTSGTRLKVRVFGGYDFNPTTMTSENWIARAYRSGVAMGGDLQKPESGKVPGFIIQAQKEADGANLDRVQMIKGWVDSSGKTHEKIYDVAVSDNRKPDARGVYPAAGNTVDLKTATYTNTIGEPSFQVYWADPDFDPAQSAFYYVRVLEIPTPRWSTYDAVRTGLPLLTDVPPTIQERAWSSPIWYNPN